MRGLGVSLLLLLALCGLGCRGPSVLHLGLDGATFDVILPLVEAGHLPTLGGLMQRGAWGELDCVPALPSLPCFCPPVWTSIATGQPFERHGVFSLLAESGDRRVPAIWNVLAARGRASLLVSYRATHPADALLSVVVSEGQVDRAVQDAFRSWPPPAATPPPGFDDPSPLLPALRLVPVPEPRPWSHAPMARDRLAVDLVLATLRRLRRPPDLTMLTLHSIDKSGHITWGRIQDVSGGPFKHGAMLALAQRAVDTGPVFAGPPFGWGSAVSQYVEADAMLASLLAAGRYDYVVITSDHGMDRNPAPGLPGQHTLRQPAAWDGIFLAAGPGIREGLRVEGVSVLDVAPTLAYLLRLPVADALPGRVLDIFEERFRRRHPLRRVDAWEALEPPRIRPLRDRLPTGWIRALRARAAAQRPPAG